MSEVDFTCSKCGEVQCIVAPEPPELPVCPACCEDHEYEYVRDERDYYCKYCGQPRPHGDWD